MAVTTSAVLIPFSVAFAGSATACVPAHIDDGARAAEKWSLSVESCANEPNFTLSPGTDAADLRAVDHAPPAPKMTRLLHSATQSASQIRSLEWVSSKEKNSGKWVALQDGEVIAAADSIQELGGAVDLSRKDVMLKKVI